MDPFEYLRRRTFQNPVLMITETVSGWAILWVFLFGPLYYWRKGALIEALLMALGSIQILGIGFDDSALGFDLSDLPDVALVVWIAFSALAPALLIMRYRRRGWVELS
jgi:hypothetical protein